MTATVMQRICAWCDRVIGSKPGEGETHGVCPECKARLLAEQGLGGGAG